LAVAAEVQETVAWSFLLAIKQQNLPSDGQKRLVLIYYPNTMNCEITTG
jgi:hypothetical protein